MNNFIVRAGASEKLTTAWNGLIPFKNFYATKIIVQRRKILVGDAFLMYEEFGFVRSTAIDPT
jgi:hypothetical protein